MPKLSKEAKSVTILFRSSKFLSHTHVTQWEIFKNSQGKFKSNCEYFLINYHQRFQIFAMVYYVLKSWEIMHPFIIPAQHFNYRSCHKKHIYNKHDITMRKQSPKNNSHTQSIMIRMPPILVRTDKYTSNLFVNH